MSAGHAHNWRPGRGVESLAAAPETPTERAEPPRGEGSTFVWRGVVRFWNDPPPTGRHTPRQFQPAKLAPRAEPPPHVNVDQRTAERIADYAKRRGLMITEAMDEILADVLPPSGDDKR